MEPCPHTHSKSLRQSHVLRTTLALAMSAMVVAFVVPLMQGLAAQSLRVIPSSQLSVPGAPVVVQVEFTAGPQPVSGFSLSLSHSAGALTFVSATSGSAASAAGAQVNGTMTSPGNISLSATGTSAISSGVVAVLSFTANGTGNPFPPVTVTPSGATVTLVAGGTATPTLTPGTVTFIDRLDVDASLSIDVVDVQLVVNFILALATPSFTNHGDCNGDQSVDVVDIQLIVNTILNPNQQLGILTQAVPAATLASPYSFAFSAVGGAQPYTWTETAQSIPGLTLSATGVLSGNATQVGQYSYSVRVTDANNTTANATFTVMVSQVVLQSVTISPSPITLAHNSTTQLTATGTYSDTTTADVTAQMNWSSNAPSVATVGFTTGLVTGVGPGTASITCVHPTLAAVTASANVTVTKVLVSLSVTPSNPSVVRLLTQAFTATATFSDSTTENVTAQSTWTTSVPATASVSAVGVATGLLTGSSTITASYTSGGVTRTATSILTVTQEVLATIAVAPSPASGFVGGTLTFTASGTFNNGTQSNNVNSLVTWSSSVASVATINTSGVASMLSAGSTVITATRIGGGVSGTSSLTVSPVALVSITVTPTNPSIQAAATQQFTAAGVFSDSTTSPNVNSQVIWSSSNTSAATINSSGLATGVAAGTTTITATRIGGGVSGSATLTVTGVAGISYSTQIVPLWQTFGCLTCHPSEGGYSMTTYAGVMGNASHGPPVVPFNAANSHLYQVLVTSQSYSTRMPENGPYMSAAQRQLVADWINQGALNN